MGKVEVGRTLSLTLPRLKRNVLERVGIESFARTSNLILLGLRREEVEERLGFDVGNLGKTRIPIPLTLGKVWVVERN